MRVVVDGNGERDRLDGVEGRSVHTYDDEVLGVVQRVVATRDDTARRYLVVKGELFGTGEYFVPESEIERVGPARILLGITRDDLREHDWLSPPPGLASER